MNYVCLMGRLTKDPEVKYSQGSEPLAVAKYTLAVDRKGSKEKATDFINCVAFGKRGEFAEKYLHKGMKIAIEGSIQTGSYEKDGQKHYTFTVNVSSHEFAESKADNKPENTDFMNIPENVEELPFK